MRTILRWKETFRGKCVLKNRNLGKRNRMKTNLKTSTKKWDRPAARRILRWTKVRIVMRKTITKIVERKKSFSLIPTERPTNRITSKRRSKTNRRISRGTSEKMTLRNSQMIRKVKKTWKEERNLTRTE